jgi:hypothetical protein
MTGTVRDLLGVKMARTARKGAMGVFAVAIFVLPVVFLGALLCVGLATLMQIRNGRRERLQMKRHLQRIERAGWNEMPRPYVKHITRIRG